MADSLLHPSDAPRSTGPMGWVVRGPWAVASLADLMYSSKQAPFLVTETNAGSIGFSATNQSPYDGQWRQLAWLLVARGARLVEYWHWHTLPFGAEAHWGGVLPHSGTPGRAYREIARIGAELGPVGDAFEGATPDADVAVLYDSDSKFAMSTQGPLTGGDGQMMVDPDSYRHVVAAFSRGIFDAKRQQRLVRREQLDDVVPERFPVLVVPALFTASDDDLDRLADYARAGGHLVLGPRTGYGDGEGLVRAERAPARLADAAGAWFEETSSLAEPVPVTGSLRGAGTTLAEGLVLDGAEALATYAHPHLGRWAAVTTRPVGAGRVTVVGTVPDQELAADLVRWLAPSPVGGWTTDASVTVSSEQHRDRPAARHPQLGLGAGRRDARHRGHRPAHRRAPSGRARDWPSAPGTCGWSRARPGDRTAGRCNPARHRSFSLRGSLRRWRGSVLLVRWTRASVTATPRKDPPR